MLTTLLLWFVASCVIGPPLACMCSFNEQPLTLEERRAYLNVAYAHLRVM